MSFSRRQQMAVLTAALLGLGAGLVSAQETPLIPEKEPAAKQLPPPQAPPFVAPAPQQADPPPKSEIGDLPIFGDTKFTGEAAPVPYQDWLPTCPQEEGCGLRDSDWFFNVLAGAS